MVLLMKIIYTEIALLNSVKIINSKAFNSNFIDSYLFIHL